MHGRSGQYRQGNGQGRQRYLLAWFAALLVLAGCSKDAVDEQKRGTTQGMRQGMNVMNPGARMQPPYYPAPAPSVSGYPQTVPGGGMQGRYSPPGYGQPYGAQARTPVPPAGGWQTQGGMQQGWNSTSPGYPNPGQGYGQPGYWNPGTGAQSSDWSRQGQQLSNPWAGAGTQWQQPGNPGWNSAAVQPRYRPLDEDEKARARQGSNPWVAPYDKPIGSSHSEQPSPPVVPGLAAPGVVNPYGYGVFAPGLYGTGLPTLGYYPGVPGVLGPWGW